MPAALYFITVSKYSVLRSHPGDTFVCHLNSVLLYKVICVIVLWLFSDILHKFFFFIKITSFSTRLFFAKHKDLIKFSLIDRRGIVQPDPYVIVRTCEPLPSQAYEVESGSKHSEPLKEYVFVFDVSNQIDS